MAEILPWKMALMGRFVGTDENQRTRYREIIEIRIDKLFRDFQFQAPLDASFFQTGGDGEPVRVLNRAPDGTMKPPTIGSNRINPEDFECARCGGKFIPETVGMFQGRRYVHTCGETDQERRIRQDEAASRET